MSQIGSFPQIGMNIKTILNHLADKYRIPNGLAAKWEYVTSGSFFIFHLV